MAKCLRCGAGNEWLQGTVAPEDKAEIIRLRAENAQLAKARAETWKQVQAILDESWTISQVETKIRVARERQLGEAGKKD